MKRHFSIGEMADFFNLSIKTLRYYDEIGLIRPSYVNPQNRYRYYSMEQFIVLDVIKNGKQLGMSLEEIKNLVGAETSLEELMTIIERQEVGLKKKIHELEQMQRYMTYLKQDIREVMNVPHNEVLVTQEPERFFVAFKYQSENSYELEMNLRQVILTLEKEMCINCLHLGTKADYKHFKERGVVSYRELRNFHVEQSTEVLPKGKYLTLIYDDNSSQAGKYYGILMDYIEKHQIKVKGDFNETWIMPRVGSNQREKTLSKIDILIDESNT